jgi:(p)ppGpp synthase/HD superfamily hydrolase
VAEQQAGRRSRYSPRIDAALSFAAEKHAQQCRKGTSVPYIVHPVHVARLLEAYGQDEDTVVAGILHDVLEDTACTREELLAVFGEQVADTVRQCSEPDKTLPWEERKSGAVNRMRQMTPSARAVCCADKAHNLHTIADALDGGENTVWLRFRRGPAAQLGYHRAALAALSQGWSHPLLGELEDALARLDLALGRQG